MDPASGHDVVKVISLRHTFVRDRAFKLRNQTVQIPGIATVLADMVGERAEPAQVAPHNGGGLGGPMAAATGESPERRGQVAGDASVREQVLAGAAPRAYASDGVTPLPPLPRREEGSITQLSAGSTTQAIRISSQPSILAYPDTNSLLIKGSPAEVDYLSRLVEQLDIEKTQIELSLWIIDLNYRSLERLGVRWQAGFRAGGLGATLNVAGEGLSGALSTLDGARFLASVFAMSEHGQAQVVSRPLILTQENVPAIFDNNRTFYAKLIGERTTSLDQITYGTLVSVIPRLSVDHSEIEMILDIEDGDTTSQGGNIEVDGLPIVGRTHINTIARVPRELSLLIGGYTRHAESNERFKIPLLGDIPVLGGLFRYRQSSGEDVVRVFLIQPRLLPRRAAWDGEGFREVPQLKPGLSLEQGTDLLDRAIRREQTGDSLP
ncbi:MAG: type III secretion system outer membrane ring subunit SctC [Pararobbsia sp.]